LGVAQKNDKIGKDKFITPVYTLIGMAGFTLGGLQFWSVFAVCPQTHLDGLELAVIP
jgi:hypothetical protein